MNQKSREYWEQYIGNRYGRLVIIEHKPRGNNNKYFLCKCDCGVYKEIDINTLKKGNTLSCGCYRLELIKNRTYRHGMSRTTEHHTWQCVLDRCCNEKSKLFPRYGGRGITVCDEWMNSFEKFFEDMGLKPDPKYSLERVDNNGPYSKENCIWADSKTQSKNKSTSKYLEYDGKIMHLNDWAHIVGIHSDTLAQRFDAGWSAERILTTPLVIRKVS